MTLNLTGVGFKAWREGWRWKNQYYENRLNPGGIFPRSMMKNRIVVIEKSTNKNRTFVLFSCLHLYTFKKMSDIIGIVNTKMICFISS